MIILRKPHVTEKSTKLATISQYTFLVEKGATKPAIAKLVADKFKVDVLSVKTINVKGKVKQQRRVRKSYQLPGFKKAIVVLKKGQKIALFEAAPEQEEEAVVTTGENEPQVIKERKNILSRTKVRVEKSATGASPTTQRKVITGK